LASKEQITQLRDLGAATVYEAQGAKGALDSGMKPIDPTSRLAGPALTVDARPADNLILHYAVQKASPGDGLVVVAQHEVETAISSSIAREQKEEQQRKAIEQGATTADLLNLTDTLRRLGLV